MKIIYLIQQDGTNNYKIGITKKEPNKRLEELQIGSGNVLVLIHSFKTKFGFKLETILHKHFESKKINSEWFLLEKDEIEEFKKICILQENNLEALKENPFFNKNYNLNSRI